MQRFKMTIIKIIDAAIRTHKIWVPRSPTQFCSHTRIAFCILSRSGFSSNLKDESWSVALVRVTLSILPTALVLKLTRKNIYFFWQFTITFSMWKTGSKNVLLQLMWWCRFIIRDSEVSTCYNGGPKIGVRLEEF